MAEVINRLSMEFDARPENVGLCRLTAASFAAQLPFTLSDIEEIKVAVSEAVSNCIIHAYPDEVGMVRVDLRIIEPDILEIEVHDDGKGIENLEAAQQPTFSTDPERMGLGFVFMQSFSDEMEVDSTPGQGTIVKMRRRCSVESESLPRSARA